MHESSLSSAEKAQEFEFIIATADHLEEANGRFFNKLVNSDKGGDPNTIDKDDLKEALRLDDRKREFSRGFLTDSERKSVNYMLKHWDDEELKVIKDDLVSYDHEGHEYHHQGFADITRKSVERALTFYAQPIQPVVSQQQHKTAHEREFGGDRKGCEKLPERFPNGGEKRSESKSEDKKVSEAEILKNTQDYLSGKNLPAKEDKRYFSHYDAAEMEQRRRAEYAAANPVQDFRPQAPGAFEAMPPQPAMPQHDEEMVAPRYSLRDGINDTLGIAGGLTRAAEPFLMWDIAKEHARNQNNYYRRSSHIEVPMGPAPYFYNARPLLPPVYRPYIPNYGPRYTPGFPRYGGNYYQQDSDTNFMHAGPDGLTFSRSRQRMPGAVAPPYYPPAGDYGYSSSNGVYDALDLVNGLTSAAMPWLQWDLAKQYARNQRELYRNHR